MISAKIVADNYSIISGDRITTMLVTFPRYILAELNTHRVLSKNSASSRAIPFKTMLKSVKENPFIPIAWQKEHSGMQGTEYFTDELDVLNLQDLWLKGRDAALNSAIELNSLGATKQLCNRILEPFLWHTVLITSTEWENFFNLRCPQYSLFSENMPINFRSKKSFLKYVKAVEAHEFKDQYDNLTQYDWFSINHSQAEIHIQALAEAMWDALQESTPKLLRGGDWHIPFEDKIIVPLEGTEFYTDVDLNEYKVKVSTAMCARTSYTVVGDEKEFSYDKQIALHDRLLTSGHYSPFEHCAKTMYQDEFDTYHKGRLVDLSSTMEGMHPMHKKDSGWCKNYRGFIQYREILEK